jgi:hypothetical protein
VGGAYILSGTYSINTTLIITQDTALYGDPSAVIQGNGQIPSIFVGTSAEVILQDITVMGGHATYGSGITNQGTLYIYDSTITGNGPEPDSVDGGGGIYNVGHLVIQRSTIENNGAGGGGGIQNQNGTLLAECVKFRQNRAFTGGGLLNVHGQATLLYSSFTDNMVIQRNDGVPVQGGAIYDYPDAQTIEDDPDGSLVTGEGVYLKPFAVVIGDPGGYTDDAAGGEIEYSVIGADPTIEGNPGYAEHCQRPQNQICTQRSTTEINAYIAPEHARTERFGGTPLINPRITIPANSILQLDGRYDRASSDPAHPQLEMFIYRLRGYAISGTNIDSYENNEALWINIRGNRTEYDEASVGDCTLLEFIDVASLDPRYSIIEDIRDYGIDIQPLDMTAWSIDELQAIYNGIAMTSDALRMTRIYADGSQTFPETGLNPGWYFRDVMAYLDFGLNEMDHLTQAEEEQNHPDYIVIRRSDASSLEVPCQLEPSQSLSNVDPNDTINRIQCGVDGIPDEGMSAPNSDWTPQGMLTKELVVYLLGRIFDIRSGDELTSRIKALKTTGLRDCTYITNETGGVIMGNVYDANAEVKWKWARGVRGWGSTNPALDANQNPIQLISQFQQSPIGDDESEEFYASIAGDMFLNWVFHIADTIQFPEESYNEFFTEYDACHDVQQPFNDEFEPAQAPWLGFLNMNGYGGIDTTRSGHVRFGWMVDQMDDIFEENPDWYKYVAQGI